MLEIDIQRALIQRNVSTFISFTFGSLVSLSLSLIFFFKNIYVYKKVRTNSEKKKKKKESEYTRDFAGYLLLSNGATR